MPYTVHLPVEHPQRLTPDEAAAFLASWYRVVAPDGSTAAYAPDMVTARIIAMALSAGPYNFTADPQLPGAADPS